MTEPHKKKVMVVGAMQVGCLFNLSSHALTYIKVGVPVTEHVLENTDIVVLTGGVDVHPHMYGHNPILYQNAYDKTRDKHEEDLFLNAVRLGIPLVGICRGAQFLNVMNGGKLIQNVTNHLNGHSIRTSSTKYDRVHVSSTHHQMMHPGPDAKWKAWAEGLSRKYEYDEETETLKLVRFGNKFYKEPECLWYPRTQSLCVQWHPEYDRDASGSRQFFYHLLEETIGD